MEATRVVVHAAFLADDTAASVWEVPMRIHHGGRVSLERTWWLLVEPEIEDLIHRDGKLLRANGESVRLAE